MKRTIEIIEDPIYCLEERDGTIVQCQMLGTGTGRKVFWCALALEKALEKDKDDRPLKNKECIKSIIQEE